MLFGLGMPEILVILVIALIIFGPKNLPKLGAMFGKSVKELRSAMDDETDNDIEADKGTITRYE